LSRKILNFTFDFTFDRIRMLLGAFFHNM
jgi:hypothetical protein